MTITGHEETLRDATLPTHLMQPSEVWGERWNANPNPLARRWMETVVDKQSMVVLAADRYTMAGLTELLEDVSPHVAALKTHVDLVEDWTAESWAEFCEKAKDADMLIYFFKNFSCSGYLCTLCIWNSFVGHSLLLDGGIPSSSGL